MALTTSFSSTSREQRWVDQVSKKFIRDVAIDISDENPICVFHVPNSITIFKPEAYVPHVIALGPYHHMDPHLYQMERYKIAIAKSFFNQTQYPRQRNIKFRDLLIHRLQQLDHVVRGCYHSYLDLDDDTLSWIVAIDGLFLLNLLQDYSGHLEKGNTKMAPDAILSRDVMLVENQIPFVLLNEIFKALSYDSLDKDAELLLMMEGFCRAHSPLKLAPISSATSHLHLLDLMYHLIVNSDTQLEAPQDEETVEQQDESEEAEVDEEDNIDVVFGNIGEIMEVGMKFGIGRRILKPVQVIQDIPWDKIRAISGLKSAGDYGQHEGPTVEEIKIPPVSSLHHYAGIRFRCTRGGIRDIKFVEEEATLYLPIITLDVHSEVVLRNLVAYETATNYSHCTPWLSQFVDLISGIIDSPEDVRLLKESGIIKGGLTNKQIAELFNGMNKATGNSNNKTATKINEFYKKRPVVKIFMLMKKLGSLWKVVAPLSTVVLLLMLVLYSFCQFYGCSKLLES